MFWINRSSEIERRGLRSLNRSASPYIAVNSSSGSWSSGRSWAMIASETWSPRQDHVDLFLFLWNRTEIKALRVWDMRATCIFINIWIDVVVSSLIEYAICVGWRNVQQDISYIVLYRCGPNSIGKGRIAPRRTIGYSFSISQYKVFADMKETWRTVWSASHAERNNFNLLYGCALQFNSTGWLQYFARSPYRCTKLYAYSAHFHSVLQCTFIIPCTSGNSAGFTLLQTAPSNPYVSTLYTTYNIAVRHSVKRVAPSTKRGLSMCSNLSQGLTDKYVTH